MIKKVKINQVMCRNILFISIVFSGIILIVGCNQQQNFSNVTTEDSTKKITGTSLPKGDRILSIDVNMAEDGDYDKAFRLAKEARGCKSFRFRSTGKI